MNERSWTVGEALGWTVEYLGRKDDSNPRVSAEWLLSASTGLSRVEIYAHHDRPLTADERAGLKAAIERRAAGEPLQYVTGEMPFRHVVLKVRPGVFIPRPETEILVDVGLAHLDSLGRDALVADVCTGSGAVACAVATELPGARVWATDVSAEAVAQAAENAGRLGAADRVSVLLGDLLAPLPAELRGRMDAVLANPPYVPAGDLPSLPEEVRGHEPLAALDGGADGLQVARRLMVEALGWLAPGGLLAIELDESCVKDADRELRQWYEGVRTVEDLAGRPRVVCGTAPGASSVSPVSRTKEADRP